MQAQSLSARGPGGGDTLLGPVSDSVPTYLDEDHGRAVGGYPDRGVTDCLGGYGIMGGGMAYCIAVVLGL